MAWSFDFLIKRLCPFGIHFEYQQINVDDRLFDGTNKWLGSSSSASAESNKAEAWAVGLNWYLNNNIKIAANYERTSFSNGGVSGLSTAASTVNVLGNGNRADEESLFTRLQIAY